MQKTHLLSEAQTAKEERHAQDEQKVGEDRAEEGSLDNTDFILHQVRCLQMWMSYQDVP